MRKNRDNDIKSSNKGTKIDYEMNFFRFC